MIQAVLFDYGGVLCANGGPNGISQALATIFGIDEKDIQLDELHPSLRVGTITSKAFFAELNRRYGNGETKLNAKMFHEANAILERTPQVYALAETLRAHGIKTGILSNIYQMTADLLRANGRYEGFDPVILSCEEHLAKPDAKLYDIALQKLGVPAKEVLFIDDQEKCLPPAQALGIHTILAQSPEQIIADAAKLLKTENNLDLAV